MLGNQGRTQIRQSMLQGDHTVPHLWVFAELVANSKHDTRVVSEEAEETKMQRISIDPKCSKQCIKFTEAATQSTLF